MARSTSIAVMPGALIDCALASTKWASPSPSGSFASM
jgi:hypothetical protein